jgi:hypothetical protein
MASESDGPARGSLTAGERRWLADVRAASDLDDLRLLTGRDDVHDAYFGAKRRWRRLRGAELDDGERPIHADDAVPGRRVDVDGHTFHVHGVTHADTDAERAFLRAGVREYLGRGATVYCEQGIREMYFDDVGGICAMDDYRWAMERCRELGVDSHVDGEFEAVVEDLAGAAGQFREATFKLVDRGGEVYGDRFRDALGAVASQFLRSHEDLATGRNFESFRLRAEAAETPETGLERLQRYYERAFLPQALEREWLRRHDHELELVTHARNERMADYAVFHNDTATEVHLVVGAAHGPGVAEYLEAHADGRRSVDEFELA